jgi:hypothetical protein
MSPSTSVARRTAEAIDVTVRSVLSLNAAVRERSRSADGTRNRRARQRVPSAAMSGTASIALLRTFAAACRIAIAT